MRDSLTFDFSTLVALGSAGDTGAAVAGALPKPLPLTLPKPLVGALL